MSEEKIVKLSKVSNKTTKKEKHAEESMVGEPVYCSFCGKPNSEVLKMVKGPGVNICSDCTLIAVQYLILNDRLPSKEAQKVLDTIWRISK